MIKIGMMIGDRYEILEKIGTGGMSDVYKSKDHKLNRYVAIKVLKQEFSENANFVSKFRVEAQAAAGLMHPNIVNVYDVGEENGIYYIVMVKEIERAGIPVIHVTNLTKISEGIGSHRILRGNSVLHVFGNPSLPAEQEVKFRKGLVEEALKMLTEAPEEGQHALIHE